MHIATLGSARVPESSSVRPAARGAALACLVAATLLATGTACSSGSGGGSEALTALRHLPADVHASKQVTYVDEARIRKMSTSDPKRFRSVETPGSALLNQYEAGPWGTSLKASQIGTAVDSSLGGHWDGTFDAAAVTASLKAHGFTPTEQDGKQVWKRSGGAGPSFVIAEDEIRYATDAPVVTPGDPDGGASLADKKEYRQVADCLGDVYRADFNPLSATEPVRLSALGQQADDAGRNTEVLCVVVKDQATADRLAAKLRSVIQKKAPRFDGTKVTVGKGDHPVVRAGVPDSASQRPGRLFVSDLDLWMAVASL